jgi:hypothetical protein
MSSTPWRLSSTALDEQDQIVEHIRRANSSVDALVSKVREAVDRLKEYRTALISAAVTGKIDVREESRLSLTTGDSGDGVSRRNGQRTQPALGSRGH